jgi:hypothetical protein
MASVAMRTASMGKPGDPRGRAVDTPLAGPSAPSALAASAAAGWRERGFSPALREVGAPVVPFEEAEEVELVRCLSCRAALVSAASRGPLTRAAEDAGGARLPLTVRMDPAAVLAAPDAGARAVAWARLLLLLPPTLAGPGAEAPPREPNTVTGACDSAPVCATSRGPSSPIAPEVAVVSVGRLTRVEDEREGCALCGWGGTVKATGAGSIGDDGALPSIESEREKLLDASESALVARFAWRPESTLPCGATWVMGKSAAAAAVAEAEAGARRAGASYSPAEGLAAPPCLDCECAASRACAGPLLALSWIVCSFLSELRRRGSDCGAPVLTSCSRSERAPCKREPTVVVSLLGGWGQPRTSNPSRDRSVWVCEWSTACSGLGRCGERSIHDEIIHTWHVQKCEQWRMDGGRYKERSTSDRNSDCQRTH